MSPDSPNEPADEHTRTLTEVEVLKRRTAAIDQAIRLTARYSDEPSVTAEQTMPREDQLAETGPPADAATVEAELLSLESTDNG